MQACVWQSWLAVANLFLMAGPDFSDPLEIGAGRLTVCADAILEISKKPIRPRTASEWRMALPRYSDSDIANALAFLARTGVNIDWAIKGGCR